MCSPIDWLFYKGRFCVENGTLIYRYTDIPRTDKPIKNVRIKLNGIQLVEQRICVQAVE